MGIEPTYLAWKASALPLCYTRKSVHEVLLWCGAWEPACRLPVGRQDRQG